MMSLRKGLEAAVKGCRMAMPPATTVVTSTPAPGGEDAKLGLPCAPSCCPTPP